MYFWRKLLTDPRAAALLAAFAAFCVALFAPGLFNDGDTYWHIEAGRWMIDNRAVLHIDPFSYTFAGKPWQAHEWLSEIIIALAYVGLGWSGVALLFAATFALTAGLLGWHLSRRLSGITLIVVIILALCCTTGGLLARPHVLALPLIELWTAALIRARAEGRTPAWQLLIAMVLWANLHGSFMFGLALLVPFLLEILGEKKYDQAKRWALFSVLAVLAAMITPNGIDTLTFPVKLMAMPELYSISEWRPPVLKGMQPLTLTVGATLFVLLSRGARIRVWRLVTLLGLLYMSLLQARHGQLLAIAGAQLIADPLGEALHNGPRNGKATSRAGEIFCALILLAVAVRLMMPIRSLDNAVTPAAALAHLPEPYRHQPMLNEYAFGGYLIFNDMAPFIDGRAELYGQDFLRQYGRLAAGDSKTLNKVLQQYRITWSLLSPGSPAVTALDHTPGWRRIYADKTAVLHIREKQP